MPPNVRATTHAPEAIVGAQYAVHAVPVQSSRAFLQVGSVQTVAGEPGIAPLLLAAAGWALHVRALSRCHAVSGVPLFPHGA